MATREEWDEIVARIQAEKDPQRSPHLGRLWEVAASDGARFLASYARTLGDERVLDLIYDLLATKLAAILDADVPRAFFCRALQNRARDWVDRGDAKVVEAPPESSGAALRARGDEQELRVFMLDARDALAAMSERDQGIVAANAAGEEVEAIAKEFSVSVDNVYAIVSRARKRFREGGS